MSASDAKARAAEVLAKLDLESAADRTTSTYSGGMKRRLDVGLGIVHRPSVLFLDEPTTGLDPQARARMWDEIRRLRAHGTTVFLTTHYLEEADALADRLAIIDHGKIVAEGTADELKRARSPAMSSRSASTAPTEHVLETVSGAAVRPRGVRRGRPRPALRRSRRGGRAAAARCWAGRRRARPVVDRLHRPSLDDVFLRQTGRSLRDEAAA